MSLEEKILDMVKSTLEAPTETQDQPKQDEETKSNKQKSNEEAQEEFNVVWDIVDDM